MWIYQNINGKKRMVSFVIRCSLHGQAQARFDIQVEKSSSSIKRTNEWTQEWTNEKTP